jgi:hypothetical protein
MEDLQEKAESGAVEMPDNFFGKEAEAKFSARREERAAAQRLQPEPEPEPEPEPLLEPEPEPEPRAAPLLSGTMAAAIEMDAASISMDNAADPADMDELDRRLRALQATQDRRRGELDSYMSQLQSRKVEASEGEGVEDLVSFPDGFEEIVQSLEREALERPWLSYLQGGGTDLAGVSRSGWEGDEEEESEEQRKVRKGYERMAKLDALLSEKTKTAKALAWQREQERWLAENTADDGGDGEGLEDGYRNAALVKFEESHGGDEGRWASRRKSDATKSVTQKLDASMSDTADKMLQRTLGGASVGKNVYSRYLTLTEEQEERVATLLDAEDPDPVAVEAAINEQFHADPVRMAAIDEQLELLRRRQEDDGASASAVDDASSSNQSIVTSEGGRSRHSRAAVGAEVDANQRANDFLEEQREARAVKAKTDSLDAQLRKLHTEAIPEVRASSSSSSSSSSS